MDPTDPMEKEPGERKGRQSGTGRHGRGGSSVFQSIRQSFGHRGASDLGIETIPISNSGLFSLALYTWMTPLMWRLYRRGVGSLLNLKWCTEDSAEYNVERLEASWNEELRLHGPAKARLGRAICNAYRKRLICSIIVIIITLTFSFVGSAFILRFLLDHISGEGRELWVGIAIVCGLVVCEIFRSITMSLAWCLNYWTGMRVREASMGLLYRKMLRLRSLKDKKIGELVNMCSNDGQRLFEVMANGPYILGGPLVFIAGSVYLGFLLGPWALLGIATYIVFFTLMRFVATVLEHYRMEAVTLTGERVGLMTEVLTCMKLIKMNAWEPAFINRILKKRGEEQVTLERASFLQSIITSLVPMIPVIASVAMFIAIILTGNDLTAAKAFTVIAVLYAISFALALMFHGVRTVADASVTCQRYKEVLLMEEITSFKADLSDDTAVQMSQATFTWESEEEEIIEPTDEDSVIAGLNLEEFDPLSSSFHSRRGGGASRALSAMNQAEEEDDEDGETTLMRSEFDIQSPPQLCEVDIIVKQGELIGICGMKGSGKTSFLSAILGRMQQLGGTVRIAGSMAYVGQEPWIINGTARDNILFGKPYDEERYKQTIACCYLEKDFETFSARDKVEIGDRGLTLSGGQKQRISLARAVYSNSDIYLLDDPLSALDVHIGRHVFTQCLKVMLKGKTIFFVTHHLEYLPKCDRVMLIHDGRVEECGSHSQLLETGVGPMYTELYQLYQSKYEKVQRHRLISMRGPSQEAVKTPQRGFSRLTRRTLSKQLSRMSTNSGIQHQFSTMSTTSGIFGDYDYVDIEDLVESNELNSTKVSWSVYWQYIRAMGGLAILIFLLVSFAVSIAVQSAATWFLAFWLMQGNGSTPSTTGSWDNASFTGSHTAGSVADHPSVQTFALVYGLFLLTMLIIMLFRSIIFVKILLKAASNLHGKLLRKTMTCPMKFFDTTPLGTILNRFSADIDEIDVRLPSNCELYLQNIFLVLLALIMICYTFPWDLLVVAPLAVVFVVLAIMFAPVVQQLKFVDSITRAPYLSHLALSMEGITTIHTFGQSERFFKQFCDMLDQNNIPFFLFYMANRWLAIFLDLMTVTIMGVTGFLIVFTVTDSTTSQAGLALTFAFQITSLFQYTLRLTIETGSRFSSVHRVQEYIENLQTEGAIASSSSEVPADWPNQGAITFNKYRMRYNDNLPLALKGVTLGIKPNEKIGIVGNSGSGKSSLGIALFRLSEAASGAIYIDDINIRDIKLSALRSRISILVQDPVLFVGTIRYNLDPAGQHPQDDILWQALDKCHMKEKIQSLEGQLDGMVEENGKNFSMGERQLLCLARTLLRKSKILVLDEATASIDTRTEVLVQHTIRESCRDCTVLTIAHRINTIWDCDKVLVMEDGKPVEYNQPSVLLQKSQSKFKAMFDAMKATPRGDSINEEDEPDKRDSLGCDDAIS